MGDDRRVGDPIHELEQGDESDRWLKTPRFEDLAEEYLPDDPKPGIPRTETTMNGDDHKQGRLEISQEQAYQLQNLQAGGCMTRAGSHGWVNVLTFDAGATPLVVVIVGIDKEVVSVDSPTRVEGWVPVDEETFELLVARFSK